VYNSGHQTSLFGDNWVYKVMLKQAAGHPLVRMKPILDKAIAAAEPKLRTCYSTWAGRPACAIGTMLKLHVLQYLYRLSDPGVTQICVHDWLFRWFVDLDITDDVPGSSTLVYFRRRLEQEGFLCVLNELNEEAGRRGYLKGGLRILDATHVFSNTPKLRMRGLIRQGMNQVLRTVGKKSKEAAATLREKYRHVLWYSRGKERTTRKAVRQAVKDFAHDVAQDAHDLVDEPTGKLLKLLKRIARGNPDKLVSLTDLDAKWGHKTKEKIFGGFKVHVICAENGLVTNLETLSGNVNEGDRIKNLLEPELKREREITEVYADGLYDNATNRKYLKEEKIKAFIPSRRKQSQIQKFEVEGTGENERVKCPEGKYTVGRIRQGEGDLYYYSTKDCQHCPRFGHCVSPGEVRKKVYLSDCRRLRNREWLAKYGKRTVVERDFSHAKLNRGLERARYRGREKLGIQAALTFITENALLLSRGP
jgi:IS5 family transposase